MTRKQRTKAEHFNTHTGIIKTKIFLSILLIVKLLIDTAIYCYSIRDVSEFEVLYMPIHLPIDGLLLLSGIVFDFLFIFCLVNAIQNIHNPDLQSKNMFVIAFKGFMIKKSLLFYLIYLIIIKIPGNFIQQYKYDLYENNVYFFIISIYLLISIFFSYKMCLTPFLFKQHKNLFNCMKQSWYLTSNTKYLKYIIKINIWFILVFMLSYAFVYFLTYFVLDLSSYYMLTIIPTFIIQMSIIVWGGWSTNVASKLYQFAQSNK